MKTKKTERERALGKFWCCHYTVRPSLIYYVSFAERREKKILWWLWGRAVSRLALRADFERKRRIVLFENCVDVRCPKKIVIADDSFDWHKVMPIWPASNKHCRHKLSCWCGAHNWPDGSSRCLQCVNDGRTILQKADDDRNSCASWHNSFIIESNFFFFFSSLWPVSLQSLLVNSLTKLNENVITSPIRPCMAFKSIPSRVEFGFQVRWIMAH